MCCPASAGGGWFRLLVNKYNFAALRFEAELHPLQPAQGLRDGVVALRRGVKHQEPARARAEEFAAERAGLARLGIPFVNDAGADPRTEALFQQPSFMDD